MQLKLLAFAQAADLLGFRERIVECSASDTARTVIERLPGWEVLASMRVAMDGEYREWDEPIGKVRELALIPPVSGG